MKKYSPGSKALHSIATMILLGNAILFAQTVEACSTGSLDGVNIGDGLSDILVKFNPCWEATPIELNRYRGEYGEGLVICSRSNRDTEGKRVLLIDNRVAGIRSGHEMEEFCSWGSSVFGD